MKKNTITEAASPRRVSPFAQCMEKDEYFTGFGHLNVFASIRRDIDASVPIIVLTGEGGCGKSALGRMLMSETISGCIPVYFRKTIDSFEDVVAVMASKVGVEVLDTTRAGIAMTIDQIATAIEQRGERFLLICDGAEQIYLATLERIRKMLDRLNRPGVLMQIILIGRPVLLDNLKQLRLCNFEEISEKKYVLEPLSPAETTSYLEFSKKRMSEAEARLFTPDVVDRIYRASAGNIKNINSIAEEIYSRNDKESSFWVLLENVDGGATAAGWSRYKRWLELLTRKKPSLRVVGIGGALVGLGLLLFVFTGAEEKQAPPSETTVADNMAGKAQGEQEITEPPAPDPAVGTFPGQAVREMIPETGTPLRAVEQEAPVELPPGNSAVEPSVQVAAEGSELPPASTEGQITGDGGTQPLEQAPLSEDRQQVELLLAEAQEAVEAAGQVTTEAAPAGRDGHRIADAGTAGSGKDSASVTGEDGASADPATKGAEDSEHTMTPALPLLRPDKIKKVVLTKRQIIQADSQQVYMTGSGSTAAAEGTGTLPRIYGREGKKKVLPESVALTAVQTVKQVPSGRNPGQPGREGGLDVEKTGEPRAENTGNHDRISPVRSESKKIPVLGQAIVPRKDAVVESPGSPGRVDADSSWLAGARDSKYTMQIMALSSAAAAENVSRILAGDASVQGAGTYYVFEKKGTPPEILVFLGEYDSIAEAEKARALLPETLRKYKPYVLSVKSAMQKVK